ncbi:SAM-dependent methyltransferase [Pullulanibacillus camelliae]|uniref:SAM-dependent methyltransferase n=1 Tax=Pullulanibacillus camelliae TaxID=1707096 RepID=A0A8J2YN04_9BACL|nr:class I SAM-dependent methyltransferase [Pullulanibacillus camelliae]GGE55476.1 SAM-dependent methyltransferase [Pullulanibacillus camelliae]
MTSSHNAPDHWNATLYDTSHAFVSRLGSPLLALLDPKPGEAILDIGCGTGDLASEIQQSGAKVKGIDSSSNMIDQAKHKYPDIPFELMDVTQLAYVDAFDAVFSNATLHWIKEAKKALLGIYQSLKPGGRFIAELGGDGNVQTIIQTLLHELQKTGHTYTFEDLPWYFPSIGNYASLMESAGFRVTFARHFDRPTPLSGEHGLVEWLNMFCTGLFPEIPEEEKIMVFHNTEAALKSNMLIDGTWVADYKRLQVIGLKE